MNAVNFNKPWTVSPEGIRIIEALKNENPKYNRIMFATENSDDLKWATEKDMKGFVTLNKKISELITEYGVNK